VRIARLRLLQATEEDAAAIAALRSAVARELTSMHGTGHWSSEVREKGVQQGIATSFVGIARDDTGAIIGTLRLATKKPWAIDVSYFTPCTRPLYLTDMAVRPDLQGHGLGRRLLIEARRLTAGWPADAIRLDAYDAAAGAGGFYARCGFEERGRVTYRGCPLIYYESLVRVRDC
jgi:GNAT superfamily N-acetyltransferase